MSMLPIKTKKYDDGRTKQSFKDSTDINKMLAKAQREGSIAHLNKYPSAVYGEFTGVDLLGAFQQVERAQAIFADLPSEVRKEFAGDAFKFAAYASDPANIDRLEELIPAIAKPGRYFPDVRGSTPPDALRHALAGALEDVLDVAGDPQGSPPGGEPAGSPESPPEDSGGASGGDPGASSGT